MSRQLIGAFTASGTDYPAYIDIARLDDGSVRVIVRSARRPDGAEGSTSTIVLSPDDWIALSEEVRHDHEPDLYMRALDPDDSGPGALQAMDAYSRRLVPDELLTSYDGPTLWGVMSPPLPDAKDNSDTAHVFNTREEAEAFCRERRAALSADQAGASE